MTGRQLRQLGILGGLGTVLGTVIYVQSSGVSSPDIVTSAPSAAGGASAPRTAPTVADVRLDALRTAHGEPPASDRNPFRFRARAVDPAVRTGRSARATPVPTPVPVRPEQQGPPPPPPIGLRFIGIVDPAASDARAAIFSDMRGNVFSGREGDIIEGRYRVLRVGADAAELAYLDGRGRQTIRLSGQ